MNSREYWGLAEAYAKVYSPQEESFDEGILDIFKSQQQKDLERRAAELRSTSQREKADRAAGRASANPATGLRYTRPTPNTTRQEGQPAVLGRRNVQWAVDKAGKGKWVGADKEGVGSAATPKPRPTTPAPTPTPTPTPRPTTPTPRPTTPTPTSQVKPSPVGGYKKDTSITDMIGRSQVRQGAPINTGNRSSDIRAMAARGTDFGGTGSSAPKPAPTPVNKATGSKKPGSVYSGFDMFDLVKGHLLDEGYADTEEAAIVIMANMSEEWRQNILFQEQSLAQAFAKAGKPGVPSEKPTSTTSLDSLRRRNTSDKARPSGNTSGVLTTPLNQSSYRGRVEAGRSRRYSDNPNYTGPLTGGAGSGTKDKMPGTTPSNNPRLDQDKPKSIFSYYNSTKPPKPNYNRFI